MSRFVIILAVIAFIWSTTQVSAILMAGAVVAGAIENLQIELVRMERLRRIQEYKDSQEAKKRTDHSK